MKAVFRHLCRTIPFFLPILMASSEETPTDSIDRQIRIFDTAGTTDTRLQAASMLARMIRADGREEEFDRIFREQAEADPATTAPLLALSECMRVWDCPAESAKLLAEAATRQPSDFRLQTLLADRCEQAGEPARAAAILARLVAEHRSPEHLRRYAAFLFRTGDVDLGCTLASQLAHEAKDGREPEALALELLALREWTVTRDFLAPLRIEFPTDWRLSYLHACALERLAPNATAFAAFCELTTNQSEIPNLITPVNDSQNFGFFNSPQRQQYLKQLPPEDALLARYHATAHTAYPPASLSTMGSFPGASDSDPAAPLPLHHLPATVMDLRLNALRHCFTLVAGLPAAERAELLDRIHAPDLPFLDALKTASISPPDARPSSVGNASMGLSIRHATDETTKKLTDVCKALQAAVTTADHATAADLTNQAISLYAETSSGISFPASSTDRRIQYLHRIAGNPPKPFSPGEIRSLFQINSLTQALASRGATFLNAHHPESPLPSPARLKLLKILGETTTTAEPESPPAFKITDPAGFVAAVARIESPFHRVLVLHACGLEDELRKTLFDLTHLEAAPRGDILLWASAYQADARHDIRLAYDLATRARAALGPEHQAAADAQLVALGLLLLKEKETPPNLSAATSATLGFSRFAIEESHRKALAQALKSFGQDDAAARLTKPHFITIARSKEKAASRKSPPDAAAAAAPSDRPAAIRLLYRHLRCMLRCDRFDRSSWFSPDAFLQSIQQPHLVPDLAATMLPPPGASHERRREYAVIMAKLDDLTKALPLLETLHTEQPGDTAVLSLLCTASPMPRRLELFGKLCQFSGDDLSDFAAAFIPKLRSDGVDDADGYRSVIAEWRTIPALLAALPPEQSTSKRLAWLNEAAVRLADSPPSLHDYVRDRNGYPGDFAEGGRAELAQLRDIAVKEVAIAMLKHPETATHGFILLSAGKIPFGLDEDALHAMAVEAYRTRLTAAGFEEPFSAGRFISYHREGYLRDLSSPCRNLTWNNLTPFRHLLARATGSNRFHQSTDFLTSMPEAARTEMAAWLDYFATPTPAAAIALLRSLERECQACPSENSLTLALELTALCHLNPIPGLETLVDQAGVAFSGDARYWSGQNIPNMITLARAFVAHFDTCGTNEEATPLVSRAVNRVLGPPSCWPLYAKVLRDGCKEQSVIEQRHRTFNTILNLDGISRNKPDFTLVRLGLSTGLLDIDGNHPNLPTIDSYCKEHACADELIASGLFRSGPGMFFPDGTFLPLKVARLASDRAEDDPAKTVGKNLLGVDGPNRFWARIAGALWTRSDSSIPLEEVTRELASIKQWPDAEQHSFAGFLEQQWPDLTVGPLTSWFNRFQQQHLKEIEHEPILLPADVSGAGAESIQFSASFASLIRTHPERAATLWLAAISKPDTTTTPGAGPASVRFPFPIDRTDRPTPRQNLNTLRFLLAIHQPSWPESQNRYFDSAVTATIGSIVHDSSGMSLPLPNELATLPNGASARSAALIHALRDLSAPHVTVLICSALGEGRFRVDEHAMPAIVKWLETDLVHANPLLANFFHSEMLLFLCRGHTESEAAKARDLLAALVQPAFLTHRQRLKITSVLCNHSIKATEHPDYATAAVQLLTDADASSPESASYSVRILHRISDGAITAEQAATCCTTILPKLHETLRDPYILSDVTTAWLRLATRGGREDLFAALPKTVLESCKGDLSLVAKLLSQGWQQSAAALVPPFDHPYRLPNNLLMVNTGEPPPFHTSRLEQNLSKLLARIEDPAQRFRLEAMLGVLPDPEKQADLPTMARTARINRLSARFIAEAPGDDDARLELLAILGAGDRFGNLPEMLKLSTALDYSDLLKKLTTEPACITPEAHYNKCQIALIHQTLLASLRAGQTDFWCRQMANLSRFSDLQNKAAQFRTMTDLLDTYGPRFISLALSAPATGHDRLLREATAVVLPFANADNPDRKESISNKCYQFLLLTHLATGRGRDFAACWKSLPPALTKPRERTPEYSGARVLECFHRENYTAGDGSTTTARLFSALLVDPDLSMLILPHLNHLHRLTEVNFVTREEITASIDAVPDSFPRKAAYLIGRAGLSGYYDNQTDIAINDCARAVHLADAQHQAGVVELAKATQVRILVRGDRHPQAAKIADTVDANRLDDQERKDFIRLREFLKSESENR
jgi:hypothetical protein